MKKLFIICSLLALALAQANENDIDIEESAESSRPSCRSAPKAVGRTIALCTPPCSASTTPVGTTNVQGKDIDFMNCRESWESAQAICKERGGRLWEPRSQVEYDAVFAAIGSPPWLTSYFHWWIGFRNPDGTTDAIPESGSFPPWRQLNENNNNQDCVDIWGNPTLWGDHQCSMELPFICEKGCYEPCQCKYQGNIYKCGESIGTLDHCCTYVRCDEKGFVTTTPLLGSDRKPTCGCCRYKDTLIPDGGYYNNGRYRYLCCKGRLHQVYGFIFPELEVSPERA